MAIIKHVSHKGSDAFRAVEYYTQVHNFNPETHKYEPVLDDFGLRQERFNCKTTYINAYGKEAPLENWATDCYRTNRYYAKNNTRSEIKTHEFIISFREEDSDLISWENMEQIAREYINHFCQGHQALYSIHRDTPHPHIHVTINSVRSINRPAEEWMTKNPDTGDILSCEMVAGCKFQDSNALKRARNDWILARCAELGLSLEDNNRIADERKEIRHKSKNDYLRYAFSKCVHSCHDMATLKDLLYNNYGVKLIVRGSTVSLQHPHSQKPVRLKTLCLLFPDGFEITSPESKTYFEWIKERRIINLSRASNSIIAYDRFLENNDPDIFNRDNYSDLRFLLRQVTAVRAELQIEIEKMDRLLNRWRKYRDATLSDKEREWHRGYVEWCGCDCNSEQEFSELISGREAAICQLERVGEMLAILQRTSIKWKNANEIDKTMNNYAWSKIRNNKLKHQLKYIRANRRKLDEIVTNCEKAARRRTYLYASTAHLTKKTLGVWPKGWEKYGEYYQKYINALEREQHIRSLIKENRKNTKALRKKVRKIEQSVGK